MRVRQFRLKWSGFFLFACFIFKFHVKESVRVFCGCVGILNRVVSNMNHFKLYIFYHLLAFSVLSHILRLEFVFNFVVKLVLIFKTINQIIQIYWQLVRLFWYSGLEQISLDFKLRNQFFNRLITRLHKLRQSSSLINLVKVKRCENCVFKSTSIWINFFFLDQFSQHNFADFFAVTVKIL